MQLKPNAQNANGGTSVDPYLPSSVYLEHHTWRRTPSQIMYEVAALPAYVEEEEDCQIDSTGDPDSYRPMSRPSLIYMFIGITALAAMSFMSKLAYINTGVTPLEVSYARFVGIIIGNMGVTCFSEHTILEVATGLEKSLLFRALAGTFAHICYCYALFFLDCSMAITLNITNYFLINVISSCQRRVVPKIAIFICIVLSIPGIGILAYAGGPWTIVPLIGSLGMVISYIIVRQIKSEIFYIIPPTYLGVCGAIVSSWGLLYRHATGTYSFSAMTAETFGYLLVISFTGWISQIFQTWAMQSETSWRTTAISYLIVGYAFVFDLVEGYKGAFSGPAVLGAILLVGANLVYSLIG